MNMHSAFYIFVVLFVTSTPDEHAFYIFVVLFVTSTNTLSCLSVCFMSFPSTKKQKQQIYEETESKMNNMAENGQNGQKIHQLCKVPIRKANYRDFQKCVSKLAVLATVCVTSADNRKLYFQPPFLILSRCNFRHGQS